MSSCPKRSSGFAHLSAGLLILVQFARLKRNPLLIGEAGCLEGKPFCLNIQSGVTASLDTSARKALISAAGESPRRAPPLLLRPQARAQCPCFRNSNATRSRLAARQS